MARRRSRRSFKRRHSRRGSRNSYKRRSARRSKRFMKRMGRKLKWTEAVSEVSKMPKYSGKPLRKLLKNKKFIREAKRRSM